jgi:beta-barrel assembly-enhancing protease
MPVNCLKSFAASVAAGLLCFTALSQQDFTHYKTLVSQGPIPVDFTVATSQKVIDDVEQKQTEFTSAEERRFFESIHYSIESILHSGNVVYGDDITLYIQAVADNLLRDEPRLKKELRFYTVKSNATNAFSTEQGIIFVTTGLVSQLSSEAQLAYVLSHEIAHYTEKHVMENYSFRTKSTSRRIEKMSAHSREHEFAADRIALKLYNHAGYSVQEIIPSFDMLMYSYLPFGQVKIPENYFRTEQMYIPDSYFTTKEYPIEAEEDYNDETHTHPNIKRRKYAVSDEIAFYADWDTVVYALEKSRFLYVRNLARFECVRTSILDTRYGEALYSVFLLEREFPESVYLQQMKAQAWLGLMQLKEGMRINEFLPSSDDYEGESAPLFFFLKKLTNTGMTTVAIRTIYDAQQRFPQDSMLVALKDKLARILAKTDDFKWTDYADKTFHESAELAKTKTDSLHAALNNPTAEDLSAGQTGPKSKYDKIRSKKTIHTPESFDSLKFYAYALPDVLLDSVFLADYTRYHTAYLKTKKTDEELLAEEINRQKKPDPYALLHGIGLQKIVLVQPGADCEVNERPVWKMTDKCEESMFNGVASSTAKAGLELINVDQRNFIRTGTTGYNERNILYNLLEQAASNPEGEFVPVDYESLKLLERELGTSNVLFTAVDYYSDNGEHTTMTTLLIDMTAGTVQASVLEYGSAPKTSQFAGIYSQIFKRLKAMPQ